MQSGAVVPEQVVASGLWQEPRLLLTKQVVLTT
jgi:hypothetical protein